MTIFCKPSSLDSNYFNKPREPDLSSFLRPGSVAAAKACRRTRTAPRAVGVTVHCKLHPIREQSLSSQPSQKKSLEILHPDEAPKPRLPDSFDHPIAVMPPSRMQNTTLVMPLIEVLS
ncbi:uncharacterized protein TNCV_4035571 [Trichonephila clavipes]|nr:uncharacterized protein TNCV_4035571 [Trichonephila clavipes]